MQALVVAMALASVFGGGLALTGCQPTLTDPSVLEAPGDTYQLWGVAPFLNESGVSEIDGPRMADVFTAEAQQVEGVHTVPVNRVINAMRTLGVRYVTSHAEAVTLLRMLDLDGLVVGTVTAYDAYRPLELGMAIQLYRRPPAGSWDGLDARELVRSTGGGAHRASAWQFPVAQTAGVFDASNHGTLAQLEYFAAGRSEPESAYGSEIYQVSMDRFAHFVCYRLLEDLLDQQQVNPGSVAGHEP
ncbi:MAG: hypothetical protein GY715_22260 [Planctomycetes bacterium]|nr:hypothetical protein [Planctomycetota bacterium]